MPDDEPLRPAPADVSTNTVPHVPAHVPDETTDHSPGEVVDVAALPDGGDLPHVPGYRIEAEIARGGMGVVYLARHRQLNRLAAVKMILGPRHADDAARVRFRLEAEAIASLEHPHVVRVLEFREQGHDSVLVMEYLPGGSLDARFRQAKLTAEEATDVLLKVARGVAAAHNLGIVHRDLKPGNILFDAAGEPKVADFGLAKGPTGADLTGTEAVMGTPAYMSPEQAAGRTKLVGPPADVWAIGAMLYEAVAGRRPFPGSSSVAVLALVQSSEPLPLKQAPRDFVTIVNRCLAKEPERRYPSAGELADDLERFLHGEPIHARPVGSAERVFLWAKRKPTLAAVYTLAVLTVLLGGLGAVAAWSWSRAETALDRLDEEQQRTEAARQEAVLARDRTAAALRETEAARTALQRSNAELDLVNYLSTIDLAYRSALPGGNFIEARALLADCNPALRGWEWHYLDRLAHPELFLLAPDELPENDRKAFYFLDAKFSPTAPRLFAVGSDGTLRVWDSATGKRVGERRTDSPFIRTVEVSADGRILLTVGPDAVRVWDAVTLELRRNLPQPKGSEAKAWLTPDTKTVAVASGAEPKVRLFEVATGAEVKSFDVPAGEQVWGAGFPDGRLRLVTFDRRNPNDARPATVRVRDVESGAAPVVLEGVTPSPGARAFKAGLHSVVVDVSPDGHRVLVSSTSYFQPALWDDTTKAVTRLTAQSSGPRWFTPNGKELVGISGWKAIRLDAAGGTQLSEYPGHPDTLRFAAVSPDGTRVAAAGGQGQPLRVWDGIRGIGPVVYPRTVPQRNGHSGRFSPDGSRFLSWEDDGTAREYDTTTGKEVRVLAKFPLVPNTNGSGDTVRRAGEAYSPDGRRIMVAAHRDNDTAAAADVRIIDAATGQLELELPWKGRRAGAYGFTADGTGVYVADDSGGIGVWDLAKNAYHGAIPEVQRIYAVSPCGRYLFTDDTPLDRSLPDRRASLRDARTGRRVAVLEAYPAVLSPDSIWLTVAFSPDGNRVAVACPDLAVRIWDTATGKLASTVRDLSKFPKLGLAFTPDGKRLATTGFGVDVYDVQTGRAVVPRGTIRTLNSAHSTLAFTADGRTLLLGGLQQSLLTRVESGRIRP